MLKRISFLLMLSGVAAYAGTIEKFDYPELTVVPRASDRLRQEAQAEDQGGQWAQYMPTQASGLATLLAGVQVLDSTQPGQGILGIGIGAGWIALTSVLASTYHPYHSGWEKVAPLAKGTVREQLTRERVAEEEIAAISAAGERLKWMSFASNLGAVLVMFTKPAAPGASGFTTVQAFELGAALLSFAPLIYGYHWHDVYNDQLDYKKRIYGPVAKPTLIYDQEHQTYVPGLSLALRF